MKLRNATDDCNMVQIIQRSLCIFFSGISGDINIDDNGDRDPDFQLLDLDIASSELGVCFFFTKL